MAGWRSSLMSPVWCTSPIANAGVERCPRKISRKPLPERQLKKLIKKESFDTVMNNWKIGTRISAGFAVVILIAAALGIFAYAKVGSIQRDSTQITANSLPAMYLVGEIRDAVLSQQPILLRHIDSTDKAEMAQLERDSAAISARTTGVVAE